MRRSKARARRLSFDGSSLHHRLRASWPAPMFRRGSQETHICSANDNRSPESGPSRRRYARSAIHPE